MGYWHETCIISNLPILGDQFVVGLKAKSLSRFKFIADSYWFDGIGYAVGKLTDYGEMEDVTEIYTPDNLTKKFSTDSKEFISFCYADIFDAIVDRSKKTDPIDEHLETHIQDDNHRKMVYFLRFMKYARAGFPENLVRGSQYKNLSYRQFIAELTLKKITELRNNLAITETYGEI